MNTKFIGKECKKCGDNEKYTSNKRCVSCRKLLSKKYSLTPQAKKVRKVIETRFRKSNHFKEYNFNRKEEVSIKKRKWDLKRRYNMTIEDYQKQFELQQGICAICKEIKKLVVDHDHKTNLNRSLLCKRCNSVLGLLEENPNILNSMIDYIDFYAMKQMKVA